MGELVDWLNVDHDMHPVLVSGLSQYQLVHIHPFLDGNGRTSRLLSMLCLYRAGYDFKRLFTISEFYDRDRPAFYRALQGVREAGMDLTGWLEYFTGGLATHRAEVKQRGETAMRVDILRREHDLNERQARAVEHVLDDGRLTIEVFEALCPDVSRRTLQRDLKRLIEVGLLTPRGETDRRQYVVGESLT